MSQTQTIWANGSYTSHAYGEGLYGVGLTIPTVPPPHQPSVFVDQHWNRSELPVKAPPRMPGP